MKHHFYFPISADVFNPFFVCKNNGRWEECSRKIANVDKSTQRKYIFYEKK